MNASFPLTTSGSLTAYSLDKFGRDPRSLAVVWDGGKQEEKVALWVDPSKWNGAGKKVAFQQGILTLQTHPGRADDAKDRIQTLLDQNPQAGPHTFPYEWLRHLVVESNDDLCPPEEDEMTTVFLARWDVNNVFHTFEDLVTLYEHLLLAEIPLPAREGAPRLRLVLNDADWKLDGPFVSLWNALFTQSPDRSAHLVRMSDLVEKGRHCLSKALFPLTAGASLLSLPKPSQFAGCPSPILQSFVDYVQSALGTPVPPQQSQCTERTPCTILWIERSDYAGADHSVKRQITEESKLALEQGIAGSSLGPFFHMVTIHPETMSVEDQIAAVSSANVVMGAHGAGLTLAMFLPRTRVPTALIEIATTDTNLHYANLATRMDIPYAAIRSPPSLHHSDPTFTLPFPEIWNQCLYHVLDQMVVKKRPFEGIPHPIRMCRDPGTSRSYTRMPVPTPLRVLTLGDSLTVGQSQGQSHPYHMRLKALLGRHIQVTPLAGGGWTCSTLRSEMAKRSYSSFDVAIVLIGTNDLLLDALDLEATKACIVDVHTRVRSAGTPLTLALSLPPLPLPVTDQLSSPFILHDLVATLNSNSSLPGTTEAIDLSPVLPSWSSSPELWSEDRVHLSALGYARVADLLFTHLAPLVPDGSM